MWPVVTFHTQYPTGIVPLEGSAVTAAGRIWSQVPGVPAPVQRHSPPRASRQNSFRTLEPEVGGPMIVVGLPFW
jgi:ribosomal protein S30